MPIRGLSDRRRITRGGHIRLGYKDVSKRTGKEFPCAAEYFIPEFDDKEIEATFRQIYGDKPTRLPIAFPGDDPGVFFSQWYKCYGASKGLKCKGDGDHATRWTEDGQIDIDCPEPDHCEFAAENGNAGKPGCKPIGALQFFIKGLPVLQIFQINTSSFNSIVNLNSGIELLRMARRGQPVAGVWVDLLLKPQQAQPDGMNPITIYVMQLHIPVGLEDIQQLESEFTAPAALPAPCEEKDELLYPVAEPDEDENRPPLESADAAKPTGEMLRTRREYYDAAVAMAGANWVHDQLRAEGHNKVGDAPLSLMRAICEDAKAVAEKDAAAAEPPVSAPDPAPTPTPEPEPVGATVEPIADGAPDLSQLHF